MSTVTTETFWTDEFEAAWEGFETPMADDGRYLDITDAAWITAHPADYEAPFVERAAEVVKAWPARKAELQAIAKAEQDRRARRNY